MSVQALTGILGRLTEIHESLLQLADDKKEALIRNEIDQINRIVHKESALLKQITELEQARKQEVERILIQRGFKPDSNVTISDICRLLFRAEDKKAVQNARDRLISQVATLKQKNELNQQLIKQSLAFVQYSIDLLIGPPDDDFLYQKSTNPTPARGRQGLFDAKA